MPTPMAGESKDDFMPRCIPMVLNDGTASSQEQATAICSSMFDQHMNDRGRSMKRAYSWLNIRSVDEEKRVIEGIATTPKQARDGDILETAGIQFNLPLPFLYQHNSRQPLGNVTSAKVGKDGISVRVQIAPPGTADFIDEAWRLMRAGLVRGLSIGWRTLQEAYDKEINGFRIMKSEWLELSAVSVPADANATITSVRSADEAILAALGTSNRPVRERTIINRPGVSGKRGQYDMKAYATQIEELRTERNSLSDRMSEMVEEVGGATFDAEKGRAYDELKARAQEIDTHIGRLEAIESKIPTLRPVTERAAVPVRSPEPQRIVTSVESQLPPGLRMARATIALMHARIFGGDPVQLARQNWKDTPEVADYLRARTVIEAGDTTTSGWASQLVPSAVQMQNEFLGVLRNETVLGRLGLKQVPFNIAIPVETASGTAQWVGEGAGKPVTKLTLTNVTLTWAKAAAIVVITQELAKFSSPSAEMIVRDSMVATLVRFFDTAFLSTSAAVSGVSPAGILNGISAVSAGGTAASNFRIDMNNMLNNMTANKVPLSGIKLVMSSTQALALSLMVTDLGVPLFSGITSSGGTVLGFPVVVSEAAGTNIVALNTNEILEAQDPGISVSVSDTASVEMDDAPAGGDQSPITAISTLKSFWQNNLIGIRVEQFHTWKYARAAAVEYISGNAYVPS